MAKRLTRSRSHGRRDIDLIIGTHAHVPQAYEKVNGTWVVYGMGDLLAGKMNDPRCSMSSGARFTFVRRASAGRTGPREWKVRKAEFDPLPRAHRFAHQDASTSARPQRIRAVPQPTPTARSSRRC